MKLSELRDGDIVVRADGSVRILLGEAFKGNGGYLEKSTYNDDLKCADKAFRIRKIYRSGDTLGFSFVWSSEEAEFNPGNFRLIYEAPPELPEIKIGQHEVQFTDDGIKVGCTAVSKEIVNQIYERMNSPKN